MGRFLDSLKTIQGYRYGVGSPPSVVDPFVDQALELFDRDVNDRTLGWTKRGATVYDVARIARETAESPKAPRPQFSPIEQLTWDLVRNQAIIRFSCDGKKVEPYTLEMAAEGMVLNTSAGFSFPHKKKEEVFDEMMKLAESRVLEVKMGHKVAPTPCTLGTRGVLHREDDPKRRVIYNVPAEHVVIERMFSVPVTEKLKAHPDVSPMFFGKRLLPRLRKYLEIDWGWGSKFVRADFKSYDRTIPGWLIEEAFDILFNLLDFEHWGGKAVQPAAQKRWLRVFEYVREYFVTTPVMLPDGSLLWQDGSLPSGSGLTQLIGSIITFLVLMYIAMIHGHGVLDLKVLGDDGGLAIAGKPKLHLWAEEILRVFGLILSVTKTQVFGRKYRAKLFLGYDVRTGYLKRDRMELFRLLKYPEKPVTTIQQSFTRFIAYMFLGGIMDTRFSQFFEYYQSCYEIPDDMPVEIYELETKRKYAGFDMPLKTLRSYTTYDFCHGLFNYEPM